MVHLGLRIRTVVEVGVATPVGATGPGVDGATQGVELEADARRTGERRSAFKGHFEVAVVPPQPSGADRPTGDVNVWTTTVGGWMGFAKRATRLAEWLWGL